MKIGFKKKLGIEFKEEFNLNFNSNVSVLHLTFKQELNSNLILVMDCIVWNVPRTSFWPAKGFQSAKSRSKIFPCLQSKPSDCSNRCQVSLTGSIRCSLQKSTYDFVRGSAFLAELGLSNGNFRPPVHAHWTAQTARQEHRETDS